MTFISFASVKGTPGVTTAVVGVAATWVSERQVVIVEADAAGGDLGQRFGLSVDRGIVSLTAASRRDSSLNIADHLSQLPGELPVVLAPPSSEQSRAAMALLLPTLPGRIASLNTYDVVADCGRIDATSPALGMLATSDITVICLRPNLTDVSHVVASGTLLRTHTKELAAVLIGNGDYKADEIASAIEMPVIAQLPFDITGAGLLGGRRGNLRSLNRSALVRSCRQLSQELAHVSFGEDDIAEAV